MKPAFPLLTKGASNEKLMAGLFFVLVLYHMPFWLEGSQPVFHFVVLLGISLALDTAVGLIRHKRPICAVSAAVTAAIVNILLHQISLPLKILAVVAALLPGKHVWGGTGKNAVNPALAGVFLVCLLHPVGMPLFSASLLFLPAMAASLVFLSIRPYAGLSFMAGMVLSIAARGEFTWEKLITYGVVFFGSVVLTDPTTVTSRPVYGAVFGFIAGFSALFISDGLIWLCTAVLVINLLSRVMDEVQKTVKHHQPIRIQKQVRLQDRAIGEFGYRKPFTQALNLAPQEILDRIQRHKVFGMGGAAFPADVKIKAVMASDAAEKHLIINGVECDPGLVHDRWLMEHHMHEIEEGVEILKRLSSFQSVVLAVKGVQHRHGLFHKSPEAREVHKEPEMKTKLACRTVPGFYPAGAERFLIREILHRELSASDIPAAMGILVLNVQTVIAIYRAVMLDEEVASRVITVANLKERTGHVVEARLGEKASDVLNRVYPNAPVMFTGGGLMQGTIADDEAVVTPEVNFIATGGIPKYKESVQCSRCGMCLAHCPAGINVRRVAELMDAGKRDEAAAFNPDKCIRCGICSYLCPAGRKLSQRVWKARISG
jgi:electron transport complex protein RnfC